MSNFMEILPVGAELFCEDGHTDKINLICRFRSFENVSKMNTVFSFLNDALCKSIKCRAD
jgi:hypothetical protein